MYEYEQERRWESMVRSVPAQTLGLSTVWVRVASARGIPAGDKRGTSDAYAVGELINVQTGKPLSKSRKLKTNTVKKTLDPEWNEDAEWVEIEEDVSSLALKVVVFDADVFSSDVLAGVKVPLADFIGKEGDTVTDTMKWYPLDAMGNTDMESGTLSEIQISVCVQAGVPKKIAPAPAAAAAAAAAAATIPEELRVFPSRSEDSKSTVWVKVVGARDIPAADKGGTSDAYAVYELVDCATGKPLAKPRKTKTKTAKKTLNPVWDMNESTWGNIGEAVDTLALKVTLFDAGTFTSELLGGVTIPLLAFVGVEGEMATEVLEWYTLEAVGKMDVVSASGKVQVRVGVQKAGFDMSTVRVKLKAARGISAADASGTSDPYAVAELVELGTGTLLSKNWKTKTKVVKKTLDPVWSGEDEALWGGIEDDPCGLGLKVVVWDSDLLSGNDPLGAVTIPLTTILAGSGQAGVDEWYPLSWVGEGKKKASGKEREGGGGASSAGSVQVAIQVDAAKNPRPSPKSSVANNIKKPLVEEKKKNFVTVSVNIHEARDLVAADKGGTSDPYAVAELVDSSTGKSLKRPCRKKTRAVSRTLHPVWKREQVKWEHVEVAEDAGSLDLKVNLFDNDVLAKDDLLGGITVNVLLLCRSGHCLPVVYHFSKFV
jgi:Ca2+-dependent lipid-binding protein